MNTKVTLAIPSNRGIQPKTAQSLLELVKGDYDLHINCPSEGYTIAENRNYIATQACNNGSEWLLMIDDDMTFLPDILDRLIANDKDICGVAFHPRCDDMKVKNETHHENLKSKELFETEAIGTGIVLIRTKIFYEIERPWFAFETYSNGKNKTGEDWYFCKKAKKFNIKTWCDPTIKVGHLGEKIY